MRPTCQTLTWLVLLAPALASAGEFSVQDRDVLSGLFDHFAASGVGAPDATVDPVTGTLLLGYETQIADPDERCPTGMWAVGLASSIDGRAWTVEERPALQPDAALACGARSPALLVTEDGERLLWAEVAQGVPECAPDPRGGGCALTRGIVAVELDGLEPIGPAQLVLTRGSAPSVVKIGDEYEMVVVMGSDLLGAVSADGYYFVLDDERALQAGVSDWNASGLSSPSLSCVDGGDYALELHYTGFTDGDEGRVWGWASGVSDDGDFYFIDPLTPYLRRAGPGLPSVSVVRAGGDARVAFIELPGPRGPVIASLATTPDWVPADLQSDHCTP